MEENKIGFENIINFINSNFKENLYMKNFSLLINYLNNNEDIKISEEDAGIILSSCKLLSKTFDKVYDEIDENALSCNDTITKIMDAYNYACDLDDGMMEEFRDSKGLSKSDIDLLRLYFTEISEYELLDASKERELGLRIKNGDEKAKDELVKHNLRLPINIAKHYGNKGLSFSDLIQEGNIGLMKAAEKFDVDFGYKFSTYATWWIKQTIARAIADKSRTIRIPVHTHLLINKIKHFEMDYMSKNDGKKPTIKEIADAFDISEDIVHRLKSFDSIVSINATVGEKDTTLEEFIPDDRNEDNDDKLFYQGFMDAVKNSPYIDDREQLVLELRFGLIDGVSHTLEEVGDLIHVTRERVRQIENKALSRLSKDGNIMKFNEEVTDGISRIKKYNKSLVRRSTIHDNEF